MLSRDRSKHCHVWLYLKKKRVNQLQLQGIWEILCYQGASQLQECNVFPRKLVKDHIFHFNSLWVFNSVFVSCPSYFFVCHSFSSMTVLSLSLCIAARLCIRSQNKCTSVVWQYMGCSWIQMLACRLAILKVFLVFGSSRLMLWWFLKVGSSTTHFRCFSFLNYLFFLVCYQSSR